MQTNAQTNIKNKIAVLFFLLLAVGGYFVVTNSVQSASMMGIPADVLATCEVVTGPHIDYNIIGSLAIGDEVQVLARNQHGTMVFIWSEKTDGWFPSWAVDIRGENFEELPVWTNPMKGAVARPGRTIR